MNLTKLIFLVSEDCNFNCQYCYQTKEKKEMNWETAEKSLNFFFNQKPETANLYFLGGEPLLNFSLIKDIVGYLKEKNKQSKKKVHYNITTNGSLITDEVLEFLDQYYFALELSFDGLAQDISRKKGSFYQILDVLQSLKKQPHINLHINSVFFPATVDYLSRSVEFILDLGIPHLHLSLAMDNPWNQSALNKLERELSKAREITLQYYRNTNTLPLDFFLLPKKEGIWECSAGQIQITVTTQGEVWGCPLFYEYFKDKKKTTNHSRFFFGNIHDFIKNHKKKFPQVLANYEQLSMNNCFTAEKRCFLCSEVERCEVCPIVSSDCLTYEKEIPLYICQIKKIILREKEKFTHEQTIIKGVKI